MPRIRSANPDIAANPAPTSSPNYSHGMDSRQTFIPMAFQITSPFDRRLALLPTALVMHVNPANITMNFQKKVERIQTRGGFVEQHWGDDLDDISCDGSTGAFMNIRTGLAAVTRRRTIAWDRFRDLYDLYRNNGSLHDPYGNIVLQGSVMLMWDRGTYIGTFRQFQFEETDETPYAFKISWSFKVESTILKIQPSLGDMPNAPSFQQQNKITSMTPAPSVIPTATKVQPNVDATYVLNTPAGVLANDVIDFHPPTDVAPPPNAPARNPGNQTRGAAKGPVAKPSTPTVPTTAAPSSAAPVAPAPVAPAPAIPPGAIGQNPDGSFIFG